MGDYRFLSLALVAHNSTARVLSQIEDPVKIGNDGDRLANLN